MAIVSDTLSLEPVNFNIIFIDPTRKHDLISLFYSIISLLTGKESLWVNPDEYELYEFESYLSHSQKVKYIREKKQMMMPEVL